MLMRTDPFGQLDRLAQQLFGAPGAWSRADVMPMDAYRQGDEFVVHVDLPGVAADAINLNVERNVLTIQAERDGGYPDNAEVQVSERPRGTLNRQFFLGDTLDLDKITADYDAGVLTLRIPVAETAKPRRIEISGGSRAKQITG